MTNTIYYIAKRRELRNAAPERCCLTLRDQYSSEMNSASAVRGIYKRVIEGNKNGTNFKIKVSKEEPYVTRSKYDT